MQLTTREAVEMALYAMTQWRRCVFEEDNKTHWAAMVLCEHYGFKLEQFFDVEVVE